MAYSQIVAQYGSAYHDETKYRAERARVPSQIIHEIRFRGGRFLEELDSGDWREIGDTRAIGKVRNALQYNKKKNRKEATRDQLAVVAPSTKDDNSQDEAESAQVVGPLAQCSDFDGIPSENMTAPSSEPVVYPDASVQGPKEIPPAPRIVDFCFPRPQPKLNAPASSNGSDTNSLLHDASSLSSSSALEEVRSTERPRPQQQHEPDFGITRIQNLNLVAGIMLNNVEDDAMSEMTGYISGTSDMSWMDRCSLASFCVSVATPVSSMDGSS